MNPHQRRSQAGFRAFAGQHEPDAVADLEQAFLFRSDRKLRTGASNLLVVQVYNSAFMGGIWRPVFFVASDAELTLKEIEEAVKR